MQFETCGCAHSRFDTVIPASRRGSSCRSPMEAVQRSPSAKSKERGSSHTGSNGDECVRIEVSWTDKVSLVSSRDRCP